MTAAAHAPDPRLSPAPRVLAPPGRAVGALSALHAVRGDSEHLLAELTALVGAAGARADDELLALTHLVAAPWRHEALSVDVAAEDVPAWSAAIDEHGGVAAVWTDAAGAVVVQGPERARPGALGALFEHRQGRGRAVVFPGQSTLSGDVAVAEILARTAVDMVRSSHGPFAEDAVVTASEFLRPVREGGRLVLLVGHRDPRRLVAWEVPNPTPCCAGH